MNDNQARSASAPYTGAGSVHVMANSDGLQRLFTVFAVLTGHFCTASDTAVAMQSNSDCSVLLTP